MQEAVQEQIQLANEKNEMECGGESLIKLPDL